MPGRRIASLLPSATEIVCAVGGADRLVCRSHECDHPASAVDVPIITKARIDVAGGSREIDDAVKKLSADSLSIFEVDLPRLQELEPDIIITQAQCDVCAVSEKDLKDAIRDWEGTKPEIISLAPKRFPDIWDDIRRVSDEIGVGDRGRLLLKELKQRCVGVIEKAAVATRKPGVLCLEWLDPLMAGGNWIPDMVGMAGGDNRLSEGGKHSGWIEMEQVAAENPDVIILMPCGFDLERTLKEAEQLKALEGWNKLKAVKRKRVYAVDGSAFFNRPGPRLVDSLEILGEIFYTGMIEFGHENRHWRSVY